MAENETLDLWSPSSRRWQQLLTKFEDDKSPEEIAEEATRCLYRTFKGLVDILPLKDLLNAAKRGPAAVEAIARCCPEAGEYAELIAQCSVMTSDPTELMKNVLFATYNRFLDQIEMKLLGPPPWLDVSEFSHVRYQVAALIKGDVDHLAQQVSENPTRRPRMPGRSLKQKEQDQRAMLGMSIGVHRSGTYG